MTVKKDWFVSVTTPDLNEQFTIKDRIFSARTKYQSVEIIDTFTFGRCLILDDKIQSSELDEFIYHEALVHPAMIMHTQPHKVFIAGGGEGAVLREVLKYTSVDNVIMVDIDDEVVKISDEFLPSWHQNAFRDPRVELIFDDARRYLAETNERFDVIICDLSDPISAGPSRFLFTREFYKIVLDRLTTNGIAAIQAEASTLTYLTPYVAISNTLGSVFPHVLPYCADVPSFGSTWGFALGFKNLEMDPLRIPANEIDSQISARINGDMRFYDGCTHYGLFSLPKYIRQKIKENKTLITDECPLAIW